MACRKYRRAGSGKSVTSSGENVSPVEGVISRSCRKPARTDPPLGFSLLREPFLTPIMLGGLAGAVVAFSLLWTPDATMPTTLEPQRVSVIGISERSGELSDVRLRTAPIRAGGVISLLFFILHVQFWPALDWPRSLTVLPADDAGIVQTLNATVALTMLLFGYFSLFRARALITPGLGRALSLAIALFWVARAVSGTVFFGFSLVEVVIFVAVAALYAAPQLGGRTATSSRRLQLLQREIG